MDKFDEVDWSLTLLNLLSTLSRKVMSWPSVLYCTVFSYNWKVFSQNEGVCMWLRLTVIIIFKNLHQDGELKRLRQEQQEAARKIMGIEEMVII